PWWAIRSDKGRYLVEDGYSFVNGWRPSPEAAVFATKATLAHDFVYGKAGPTPIRFEEYHEKIVAALQKGKWSIAMPTAKGGASENQLLQAVQDSDLCVFLTHGYSRVNQRAA